MVEALTEFVFLGSGLAIGRYLNVKRKPKHKHIQYIISKEKLEGSDITTDDAIKMADAAGVRASVSEIAEYVEPTQYLIHFGCKICDVEWVNKI